MNEETIHSFPSTPPLSVVIRPEVPSIHSFRLFLYRLFKSTTTQRHSRHSTDTVSELHAQAPQATASEGLAKGPNVATRAGFEPTTLWTKGVESTNEQPCPKTHTVDIRNSTKDGTMQFIHSSHFYSTPSWPSSPLYYSEALPTTVRILYRSFTLKRHRQLQVKDLPKVPTWWLEWELNPRPSG